MTIQMEHFELGAFGTNSYVLRTAEAATTCVIVDTGLDARPLLNYLDVMSLTPEAVVLTHGHADHTAGLRDLFKAYPEMKIAIHPDDADMLTDPHKNLSMMTGVPLTLRPADILLRDGQFITFAGIQFEVIHTPGHTPGGICLYLKEHGLLFSGDTLFADSVGRTDFPGGSHTLLIRNIRERLLTLPGETRVLPGHGPETTLAAEKTGNPFLS